MIYVLVLDGLRLAQTMNREFQEKTASLKLAVFIFVDLTASTVNDAFLKMPRLA